MQTKVSNNSKRYIYRKNALGRDKSVMGQMTGAVKNLDWTIMRQQKQDFCTICFFMTGMGTNLKKENACMDLNIRIKP